MSDNNSTIYQKTIREVSAIVGVPQYVLRFWESKFSNIIKPNKNKNRRYYSEEDLEMLHKIRNLLYDQGYTIKAVQNLFNSDDIIKNNINRQKDVINMEETIEKPSSQNIHMQTQLESLVMAASNEIIKSGVQSNVQKEKLSEILEKLRNIKKNFSELINSII